MIVWSGAISHPLMILIKFFTHIAICLSRADSALMRSDDFVLTRCNQEFCTHIPWLFNHRIRFRVCLGIITSDIQQRYLNYEVESQNIGISNVTPTTAPFWASPCADRNCNVSATKRENHEKKWKLWKIARRFCDWQAGGWQQGGIARSFGDSWTARSQPRSDAE